MSKILNVSSFAKNRMTRYGLTVDQVYFIVKHFQNTYRADGATVYQAKLPDGRQAKVRLLDGEVVDAFTIM